MKVERSNQIKIRFIGILLLSFFVLTVVFLFRWQILEGEKYKALASQRVRQVEIPSIRGGVLFKDGSPLAYSEPRFDIYVYIPEVEKAEKNNKQSKEEFIKKVSSVLGNEEELRKQIDSGPKWMKIGKEITYDQKVKLFPDNTASEDYVYGISFELASKRVYPEGSLASHVIGFVGRSFGDEEVGRAGIEQFRNGVLSPQQGFDFSERDSFGNVITISESSPVEARRGSTVITTIDKSLQQLVEQKLKEGVEKYKAKSGTAIVMDPKTGEIMALANFPTYDPNKYSEVKDGEVFRNNAVSNSYEIGSVMKTITMAAAVDAGKIKPNTIVVNGHNGCEHLLEERKVCTYDRKPQGTLTAVQALVKSDNIALYHTAKLIGQDTFYDYLKRFGIGELTGIDLSGESYSELKNGKSWNEADLATYSYGHSYLITPLQAITAVGAIANDGKLMQPYIVSKIIEPNGEEKKIDPVVITQPIKPETAEIVQGMMNEVYKSNISSPQLNKKYNMYKLGMKSGTALIPCVFVPEENCNGYSSQYNATYIGFDESEEKTFILLVKLERPELTSSQFNLSFFNARNVWLDIFDAIKDHVGVPKNK